jgi:hypothetical protein
MDLKVNCFTIDETKMLSIGIWMVIDANGFRMIILWALECRFIGVHLVLMLQYMTRTRPRIKSDRAIESDTFAVDALITRRMSKPISFVVYKQLGMDDKCIIAHIMDNDMSMLGICLISWCSCVLRLIGSV